MSDDPFDDPTPIASEFASADSFRGRLVLIEPTAFDKDVPNQSEPGKFADRVTATVTVLDDKGKVQIYAQKAPTGKFLEGPAHKGVWFSQDRIVKALVPDRVLIPGKKVLAFMETYKPGQIAGRGNPWGLTAATPEQKAAAAKVLARIREEQAAAELNGAAPVASDNPFA